MKLSIICSAAALCLATTAQAALFDRGGGMIYDSTQNITWLRSTSALHLGTGIERAVFALPTAWKSFY
ncbi:MAG: hypothetical protein H0W40_03575 [Methylibium sp.]|uniref:hypothetical protein n=1 Tax=Methylibium sp. TaxID=2067992 RepID=UPI0018427A6E|nr:hypothetical protein [Methylibium sp.]MBA3596442.1 hypothetical protein [Methylibium sp.]